MARGKLGDVDTSLDPATYAAINALWLYLRDLERSLDSRFEILGDLTILDSSKGLILKDTQATPHYWRVTVSNLGALVTTDLGTSLP